MSKVILDLFCKAGGAAEGYAQAGWEVIGVDHEPQKNYPYLFIEGDALEFVAAHGHEFDAIHASPPCQKWSASTKIYQARGKTYPDLIIPTRLALERIGLPSIIENVSAAPIRGDIILYGYMFGLKVIRKRKFELINWWMMQPGKEIKPGSVMNGDFVTCIGSASRFTNGKTRKAQKRFKRELKTVRKTWQKCMGIKHYMTDREISESVPPAYTYYIGKELLRQIQSK